MNLNALKNLTREAEGEVNHLYLDTAGNVTVGVGHLVVDASDALKLPLEPSSSVVADFARVKAAMRGKVSQFYKPLCVSVMSSTDVDALLELDILKFLKGLRLLYSFDSWPEPVQNAVFDMAYNLGLGGFAKFLKLRAALVAKNWGACATLCHRLGVPEDRNKRTAAMFESAA